MPLLPFSTSILPDQTWSSEHIYSDGDLFFRDYLEAIDQAQSSICIEVYIFEHDSLGERVVERLTAAHARGVIVRVIVDGIGSLQFDNTFGDHLRSVGIEYRVFNRVRWPTLIASILYNPAWRELQDVYYRLNRRDHRKILVVDQTCAFLGSMNISALHLRSAYGGAAWRDLGIRVAGPALAAISATFDQVWKRSERGAGLHGRFPTVQSSLVRTNATMLSRRRNQRDLLSRMIRARKRVWITASYFSPHGRMLRILRNLARIGVDVRIVVPAKSDVFFMPWITGTLYYPLLAAGVRIFEYQPQVLHVKNVIIDEWSIVGSSNLNYRSLFHDLEVDVVVTQPESKAQLTEIFLQNVASSKEVTLDKWAQRPWWAQITGKILALFRYWV